MIPIVWFHKGQCNMGYNMHTTGTYIIPVARAQGFKIYYTSHNSSQLSIESIISIRIYYIGKSAQ